MWRRPPCFNRDPVGPQNGGARPECRLMRVEVRERGRTEEEGRGKARQYRGADLLPRGRSRMMGRATETQMTGAATLLIHMDRKNPSSITRNTKPAGRCATAEHRGEGEAREAGGEEMGNAAARCGVPPQLKRENMTRNYF